MVDEIYKILDDVCKYSSKEDYKFILEEIRGEIDVRLYGLEQDEV